MGAYWLNDLTPNNMQNISNMFPQVTLEKDDVERWVHMKDVKCDTYMWMYLYPGRVSLVYIPKRPIIFYDSDFGCCDDIALIPNTSSFWGLRIITGYGTNVIIDNSLESKLFVPTELYELMRYKDMVNCPKKYEKPLHHFIKKAISRHKL